MFTVLTAIMATLGAAGAPQSSAQIAFDAATRAAEDGRCDEAVAAFDAILKSPAARRSTVVAGASAVRRGQCLIRLSRLAEAEESLRMGAPVLAAQAATFGEEAGAAYLALARLAAARLDYAGAATDAQAALALTSGIGRTAPLQMLAAFARFDGDGKAVAYSQEALDLVLAKPGVAKAETGLARTLHARSLDGRRPRARGGKGAEARAGR